GAASAVVAAVCKSVRRVRRELYNGTSLLARRVAPAAPVDRLAGLSLPHLAARRNPSYTWSHVFPPAHHWIKSQQPGRRRVSASLSKECRQGDRGDPIRVREVEVDRAVLTRRTVLRTAALASTALAGPFVRGAHAAGKLSFGVWDHWVPKESEVVVKLCNEW